MLHVFILSVGAASRKSGKRISDAWKLEYGYLHLVGALQYSGKADFLEYFKIKLCSLHPVLFPGSRVFAHSGFPVYCAEGEGVPGADFGASLIVTIHRRFRIDSKLRLCPFVDFLGEIEYNKLTRRSPDIHAVMAAWFDARWNKREAERFSRKSDRK